MTIKCHIKMSENVIHRIAKNYNIPKYKKIIQKVFLFIHNLGVLFMYLFTSVQIFD